MCSEIELAGGRVIECMDDLRERWPLPIMAAPYVHMEVSDICGASCLCPIDIEATAARYGDEIEGPDRFEVYLAGELPYRKGGARTTSVRTHEAPGSPR